MPFFRPSYLVATSILLTACDSAPTAPTAVAPSASVATLPAVSAALQPSATASAAPESTSAPYAPPSEEIVSDEPPKKKPIGTFKDWVAAYQGVGAPETTPPPVLRLPKDVPHAKGKIAFVQSLDIHLFDFATGTSKRLTSDPQKDFEPSFSKDGKRIYFESDRGDMRYRVYAMDMDGANVKALTGPISGKEGKAYAVSPDDKLLVYIGDSHVEEGPEVVHLVDLTTGKDEAVGENGWPEQPAWSPDGKTVYWVNEIWDGGQIFALDLATRTLRKHPRAGFGVFNAPERLGDRLLFSAGPTNAYCCREARLFTTTTEGSDIQRFGTFMVYGAAYPRVSPHKKRVAVAWNVREGGFGADWRLDVTVLNADGSGERHLTSAFPRPFYSATDPSWSGDDRHLSLTLSICPYVGCEPNINSVVVFDTDDPNPSPAFIAYGHDAVFSP